MRTDICMECNNSFTTKHSHKKYCSKLCQLAHNYRIGWLKTKIHPKHRCQKLCSMARNRAKSKGLCFNITPEYLLQLWEEQEGKCSISGIEFDLSMPDDGLPIYNSPSLDRIKPNLGYVEGNVRFVCYQVNVGIQHYGSDHFLDLCRKIVSYNDGGIC